MKRSGGESRSGLPGQSWTRRRPNGPPRLCTARVPPPPGRCQASSMTPGIPSVRPGARKAKGNSDAASAGGVTTTASNDARKKRFNSDLLFEMKRRAMKDARLNYHRLGESSLFQKLYIQPTDTACSVSPVKQAGAASLQSVVMPWPLAPRSWCPPALLAWRAYTAYQLLCLSK